VADVLRTHFFNREEDARLDERNIHFWRALVGHVRADRVLQPGATILDVGCHHGGLLELMCERFQPRKLIGIEPLTSARKVASQRLAGYELETALHDDKGWSQISDESVDVALGHEVLQYIDDLCALMTQVYRVLIPGSFAYFVLGCHTENPLWPTWKRELEELGHSVHDHAPLDVLAAAAEAGLAPALRPLRDTGWIFHDPTVGGAFSYPSVGALLDHQYRHKLLFRFERRTCPSPS
jgi:SAM-dependent methyltransferase